jgi:hypothetical protein
MLRERLVTGLIAAVVVIAFTFTGQSAYSDKTTYEYNYHRWPTSDSDQQSRRERHVSTGDNLTSEERQGREADDWIERGASSVTDSPKFSQGIRLAAWSDRRRDEHGLASAVYLFEIPPRTRSIKINVYYEGETGRDNAEGDSVGRIWIRSDQPHKERYSSDRRYEDDDQPLYGDTFTLRERKRHEEITIPAEGHVFDGMMELHVIAEEGQLIDLKHIKVEAHRRQSDVRVVTREYTHDARQPRYSSVYWYFYTGPVHHFDDRYYVRYVYPQHHRTEVRKLYGSRIRSYHIRRPHFRFHWSRGRHSSGHVYKRRGPVRLKKWTPVHEKDRRRI